MQWRKKKRKKEERRPLSRIESELDLRLSITLRLVPSSTPPPHGARHASPSAPVSAANAPTSTSLRGPLFLSSSRSPGPIRARTLPSPFPLHLLREASSSPPFRSSVIASRSRGLSASRGVP
ncbi:hypothetical protein PUN28_013621 [Cardiocondyla obscurior]|uniref:Uncharacterized protein n=1 Tax=Cardiocondyla obscurior TaxID=286306 RepID=A0AAW2F7D1_9HYME